MSRPASFLNGERGVSLIAALIMLVAVLSLGISAARIALQGEKAARNERDRQIALQAAEAALLDAETDIEASPDPARSRSHLFTQDRTEGFAEGCSVGESNRFLGLCLRAQQGPPIWSVVDFLADGAGMRAVPYGHFTGQSFPAGEGSLPAKLPRYVIELMPFNLEGESASSDSVSYFYRITAIGFGTRESTQVVLQTFYRKYAS